MKFAVISDIRYISRRTIASPGKNALSLRAAAAEQTIRQAAAQADVLLISGDLTDCGDRYSHEELAAFLRSVKAEGKKVFVSLAGHDYDHHESSVPKNLVKTGEAAPENAEAEPAEALPREQIAKIYGEFGLDEAYSVHKETASCCIELDEKTRCLMLNDDGKGKTAAQNGEILDWIGRMKDEADRDGKFLFVCSPKQLSAEPSLQKTEAGKAAPGALPGKALADMGIRLAFTGHSLFRDVRCLTGEKGSCLYNVSAPGVRFYPPAFLLAELDGGAGTLSCKTVRAELPDIPGIDGETLRAHYHKTFRDKYQRGVDRSGETVKKVMDAAKVKDVYPIIREKAKLSESEYASVKDKKLFDVITDAAFNGLTGKPTDPRSAENRILQPLCEKLDSVPDAPRLAGIRERFPDGGSLTQMMDPVLCGGLAARGFYGLNLMAPPAAGMFPYFCSSYAADSVSALMCALALFLSFIPPVAAAAGITAMSMGKNAASTLKKPAPSIKK